MEIALLLIAAVLLVTLLLFVTEWIRIDLVAILTTLSLAWLGFITPQEAVSGFASNAVISMGAVMILGTALERTGIATRIAAYVTKLSGESEVRMIAMTSMAAGVFSSVLQNIGAAAVFLPAIRRISSRTRVPVSRILMPMGFATILGGCITMIGSTPLIMLNDLLAEAGQPPFALFDVTPIGLALLLAGIVLFVVAGGAILPSRGIAPERESVAERWRITHPVRTCIIPSSSPIAGFAREDVPFKSRYGLDLLALRIEREIIVAPPRAIRFEAGQELALLGGEEGYLQFLKDYGCIDSTEEGRLKGMLEGGGYSFAELVVKPGSALINRTPKEVRFRQTFSVEPIVHLRGERETRADISELPLAAGDIIVAFGAWENLGFLASHRDLLMISEPEGGVVRHHKSLLAAGLFALALALTFSGVPLSLALLTGAAGMVLAGVVTLQEAYSSIDWKTIFLIAGLIPLGIALERSGAVALIAHLSREYLTGLHPLLAMCAIASIATLLSLIISNVATTALLVPLFLSMGDLAGASPRAVALLVAICASNSFLLPTHQVNALVMGQGGYTVRDYMRAGAPMTALFIAVAVTLIYLLAV